VSYEPQPGTIAFRAIAWLEKQKPGTEVTASVWAEAMGNVDGNTLSICLKPAIDAGRVKRFTKDGITRPMWFALGDGKRAELPEEPDDDERPIQRVVKASTTITASPAPSTSAAEVSKPAPTPRPAPAPAPAPAEPPPSPPVVWGAPMTMREIVEAEEKPAAPVPFDAWLSGVSGELVLQGVHVQPDGDVVLTDEHVAIVRRLLTGREAP
jgi:hypothetical protein